MFTLTCIDPRLANLRQSIRGVDVAGSRRIIQIKRGLIRIFEVDASEWDLQFMAGRLVDGRFVLLRGVRKRVVVRHALDAGEFRIERIDGGFGTEGGLRVGLLGYQIFGVDGRGDPAECR